MPRKKRSVSKRGHSSAKRGHSSAKRYRRSPITKESLGQILRKLPDTKMLLLDWIKRMKQGGMYDNIVRGVLERRVVEVRPEKKNPPPELQRRIALENIYLKIFKKSKLPQIEKAIKEGKDPIAIVEKVKDPVEKRFYMDYLGYQYGGDIAMKTERKEELKSRIERIEEDIDKIREQKRQKENLIFDIRAEISEYGSTQAREALITTLNDEINELEEREMELTRLFTEYMTLLGRTA